MKSFLALLLLVCVALPAFGRTHVIRVLGTQPLFGASESRSRFLALMHRYPGREKAALDALGVDREAFERGIQSAPNIITGGHFHLDAMAYYAGGVRIVRDVEIPAHTWMWVVHLPRKTVYVPQSCGNISTVAVAAVAAYETSFPVTTRKGPPTAAGTPVIAVPRPQLARATPVQQTTPVSTPVTVHRRFPWWIFLVPVALIHGNGGSRGSIPPPAFIPPSSSPSPSPSPSPKPTPTPCPTASKSSH